MTRAVLLNVATIIRLSGRVVGDVAALRYTGAAASRATQEAVPNCDVTNLSDDQILALYQLCDTSPKRGLEQIARLDPQTQREPLIMLARLIAFRRLIYGMPSEGG